ncbi:flavin monoamine oxidase family protein [Nonomuraea antri]|uniref:flavin monoamine oxidase family protein n=1 Tax=Nonomuraea antri TaxID=2730852 RepID=UPI001C2B844E|nr:NAD(P)/FAD-dependent oxidoreductase [Nonomuraea antri]
MRVLRRLVRDHRDAELLRLPVDELRGLRAEAAAHDALARRELLKRAALVGLGAGAAVALPRQARAEDVLRPPLKPARVAVVGAGIAGLTAALTLRDAGATPIVYEADPARVGGRMYTQRSIWLNGQTSEIGGELIDQEHKKMLELCRRFDLPTINFAGAGPNGAEEILHFNGSYYPRAQADEDFKAVYQSLRADLQAAGEVRWDDATPTGVALDNLSIYDWIESRVPGGHSAPLGRYFDVAYNVEYGAETPDQSSLALILLMGYQPNPGHFNVWGLSDERYHIVGGNDQLPGAIAASLPAGGVRLGWRLLAVRANSDGTQTLTFDNAGTTRTVVADHTILTVPLPVLQGLDLSRAGFDPRMTNLLRDARMGHVTKLNLQTNRRTWVGTGPWPGVSAGDCFTDLPWQQCWDTTKGQPGTTGVLIQYSGGDAARALNPATPFPTNADPYVRALAGSTLTGIDTVFPGTRAQWNGRAQLSAWHKNPNALGAYSYWPVGYLHRYAGYEGVAQGRIHLAGEHTSYDFQGFMNGGATEGERAANEVIAALR